MRNARDDKGHKDAALSADDLQRMAQMKRAAKRHHEAAERFFALSHRCATHEDRIVFQEFGRREIEDGKRLERRVDSLMKGTGRPPGGEDRRG